MVNEHHSYEFNKIIVLKHGCVYSTHNPRATHLFVADIIFYFKFTLNGIIARRYNFYILLLINFQRYDYGLCFSQFNS